MTDASHDDEVLRAALAEVAGRTAIALRAGGTGLDRLLGAIAEATVTLFDAEAASIALVEPGGGLRFRAAAGAHGAGVIGATTAPGEGIAGFVVATGQPIAVSNVEEDPRFDRRAAARTGYVPRSILAVPLAAEDRVLGVLEVLDRRGREGFDLRDQALAGVFARQAAVAIEVTGTERDASVLLARTLGDLVGSSGGAGEAPTGTETARRAAAAARRALESFAPEAGTAFWAFVDRIAAIADADPERLALLADLLEVAARHAPSSARADRAGSGPPTWRDRARLRGTAE